MNNSSQLFKIFIVVSITWAFVLPASSHADITTGLVGHWPFTGNAQDASGNGNHGTPFGAAQLTADRNGAANSAYHFDGLNSRIDIPSSLSLSSPTTAITMAAWIRRDGWGMVGTLYNPILTKSLDAPNAFQYRLITSSGGMGTALNNWNTSHSLSYVFNVDEWYHVAVTWEANTLKSYINGQLEDTGTLNATIVADNRTLSIGSDVPGVLEIFYGDIDEVRIYSRALSDDDIAEMVGPVSAVPFDFSSGNGIQLNGAFPNPSTSSTSISFSLAASSAVELEIFDLAGRRVRRVIGGRSLDSGPHSAIWDGRDEGRKLAVGGVYLYRISTSSGSATGKIILQR